MVESAQIVFGTERRVVRSLKKFTTNANTKCLVASSAMFAHNQMDGKVHLFTAEELLAKSIETTELPSAQFFEALTACGDSTVVKLGGKHFLISGFDDGVVGLLDLQNTAGKSIKRSVYKDSKDAGPQPLDQGLYEEWDETSFEHSDSVVSVEANVAEGTDAKPARILTASKDGHLYVWALTCRPDDDML